MENGMQVANLPMRPETPKKLGITIHTITFLDKADQSEMVKVARATGGFHYHASNGEELEEAFRELARHLPVALTD